MNHPLIRLFRPRLALANGVVAVAGYLLFPAAVDGGRLAALFGGVAVLAAAASALNQVLERDLDALMERTRLRPLPQGVLGAPAATLTGAVAMLVGSALLAVAGGAIPVLLGLTALVWYLAVYTPLKRRTPYAYAIGALSGALPPLLGWSSAGGGLDDYRIMLLAALLYLWQVPHFWLFQLRHASDYRAAGLPLLHWPLPGARGLLPLMPWLIALAAAGVLLPALGIVEPRIAPWYALLLVPPLLGPLVRSERLLLSYLNLFPLLLTLALVLQKVRHFYF